MLFATPRGQGRGRTVIPGFAVRYISIMLPSQTRHLMCQSKTVVPPSPPPLFLHMRWRVTREEGTTSFSIFLFFLIESSVQRPDRSFLQQRTDRSSCKQPCIEFCLVLLKVNKQRPAAFFISLAVSPSSAFRLPRLYFIVSKAVNVSAILLPLDL